MVKRMAVLLLAVCIASSGVWAASAQSVLLGFSDLQSPSKVQVEALKFKKAELSLISAEMGQNEIKSTREMMDKYGITLDPKDALEFNIIQFTTLDKAMLGLQLQQKTSQVTLNAVKLGMSDLYLGVLSAKQSVALKNAQLDLAKLKLAQEQSLLKAGKSTNLTVKAQGLEVKRAEQALMSANASYNKLYNQLKQMAGGDVEVKSQRLNNAPLASVATYLAGIDQRIEIQANLIQNQMDTLALPYYEKNNLLDYPDVKKTYDTAKRDIAFREATLKKDRLAIRQELEGAVVDVKAAENQVKSLKLQQAQLTKRLAEVKALAAKGVVTKVQVKELEVGILELDHGIQLATLSYNIKRIKLNYATSIGPAYK